MRGGSGSAVDPLHRLNPGGGSALRLVVTLASRLRFIAGCRRQLLGELARIAIGTSQVQPPQPDLDRPGSDRTVPLDHNEAFGPIQQANLVVIAGHFTEWAGGRPHTDVRLANLFDPCLVKFRLRAPSAVT